MPPLGTNRTRLVLLPVLIGHAAHTPGRTRMPIGPVRRTHLSRPERPHARPDRAPRVSHRAHGVDRRARFAVDASRCDGARHSEPRHDARGSPARDRRRGRRARLDVLRCASNDRAESRGARLTTRATRRRSDVSVESVLQTRRARRVRREMERPVGVLRGEARAARGITRARATGGARARGDGRGRREWDVAADARGRRARGTRVASSTPRSLVRCAPSPR